MIEPKVWIRKRACKGGKTTYHLRWLCPTSATWKSRKVGTDKRAADREAATLEAKLLDGTYREAKHIAWPAFTEEVVSFLSGRHAEEAKRTLIEFTMVTGATDPRCVRRTSIRAYVQHLRDKQPPNSVSTINKKLRYLRLAFRTAVSLDYAAMNPLDGWTWDKAPKRELRILKPDEEVKLIDAAAELYGFQMETFVRFVLATWARLSEATGLRWGDVRFDDECLYFRDTKSHEDRFIPLGPDMLATLRRLQAQTLQHGGPFTVFADRSNLHKKWTEIVAKAKIDAVTCHDLRRTGITRALLGGMVPAAVQKIAGHKNINTTMKYYVEVDRADLRAAAAKLRKVSGG